MFFRTEQVCPNCNAEILVYPCSTKMGKVNARSLPGWTRCECYHRFNEISAVEFDILVPGWRDKLEPEADTSDPEFPTGECSFDEALDDVKKLVDELTNSVI
jgi:hypothetical protein